MADFTQEQKDWIKDEVAEQLKDQRGSFQENLKKWISDEIRIQLERLKH